MIKNLSSEGQNTIFRVQNDPLKSIIFEGSSPECLSNPKIGPFWRGHPPGRAGSRLRFVRVDPLSVITVLDFYRTHPVGFQLDPLLPLKRPVWSVETDGVYEGSVKVYPRPSSAIVQKSQLFINQAEKTLLSRRARGFHTRYKRRFLCPCRVFKGALRGPNGPLRVPSALLEASSSHLTAPSNTSPTPPIHPLNLESRTWSSPDPPIPLKNPIFRLQKATKRRVEFTAITHPLFYPTKNLV